ncbi:MAG: branched-chain amino acid ABC transporter permease [Magnetovibrio sp.]|nr:branched-chain amino acid ABC transporter permease [Magnetovibrio sp.]
MSTSVPFRVHIAASVIIAAALPFLVPSTVLATEILIFGMAVIGCNLLLGYTGLLSFGQALFFGAGAYIASLTAIHWEIGLIPVLLLTILAGAILAAIVGYLAIRRQGIYFVMLTLAFGQLGYYIAFLAEEITGGEDGLLDVPRPPLELPLLPDMTFANDASFYGLTAVIFVLCFLMMQRLVDSPLGSVLKAIRQNEKRAEAIGYQVRLYKIAVFAFSGAITALAGGLYAMMLNFAPLSNIDIETSEQILFMAVLGGLGSLYGSVIGAGVFLVASDFFSELWPRWMLLLGLFLVVVMMFAPGGLWHGLVVGFERLRGRHKTSTEENDHG